MRKILFRNIILNDGKDFVNINSENLSQMIMISIRNLKAQFYTDMGTVDYHSLKNSEKYLEYKKLINSLINFDLSLLDSDDKKLAFWINLYNTIVIDSVVQLNIKNSVREVVGFFIKCKYKIGNMLFSADDIEHGILRANAVHPFRKTRQFKFYNRKKRLIVRKLDPRIHFTLVCGSRSCAPIKYYDPEVINDEIDKAANNFINSSEVQIFPDENRILISPIFKWYKNDFGGNQGTINIIAKYIESDEKKQFLFDSKNKINIEYTEYDWHLNM